MTHGDERPKEPKLRDPAQRWLDFGSWLSREATQLEFARRSGQAPGRQHQIFTRIMDVYFQEIRQDFTRSRERVRSAHFGSLPIRRASLEEARTAMAPRFIEALRLAFSPESLKSIAARHPLDTYQLAKRIRADFEEEVISAEEFSRHDVLRILHVEDSAEDAELIQNLLLEEWPNCQFRRVWNRPDFEEALRNDEFNLIISDHSMPDFDGLSALELAREQSPEKPFIFLSGTLGEARAAEAMKRGATDYIVKAHPVRLVPVIRDALE